MERAAEKGDKALNVTVALHFHVTDELLLQAAAAGAALAAGISGDDWRRSRKDAGDDLLMLLNAGTRGDEGYMLLKAMKTL